MSRKMAVAHFLMGGERMSEEVPMSPRLERGISLHKMIKLFTNAFAGNGGYLTFMGKTLFFHPISAKIILISMKRIAVR